MVIILDVISVLIIKKKIICSGSADGKIFFYDHSTARVMRTIEAHSAPCTDVAYHPTLPSWVATCGWDGQVKVWM